VHQCTPGERYALSTLPVLEVAGIGVENESDEMWMRHLRRALPDATLFIDVGFNKGYTAAQALARWAPEAGLTPSTLYAALVDGTGCVAETSASRAPDGSPIVGCGITFLESAYQIDLCGEGAARRCVWSPEEAAAAHADAEAVPRAAATPPFRVVAFDASRFATRLWDHAAPLLPASATAAVELHRMALGAAPAPFVEFPTDGAEHRGINTCPDCATERVALESLDNLMLAQLTALDATIDVLKVDAEGADIDIIKGAAGLLAANRVRALLFEVHGKGSWTNTSLCRVVDYLDSLYGMACFHVGNTHFVALNNQCCADSHLDDLRTKGSTHRVAGSNVFCASRDAAPALVAELEASPALLDPRTLAAECPEAFERGSHERGSFRCGARAEAGLTHLLQMERLT